MGVCAHRLLIAEDEPLLRVSMADALRKEGWTVDVAVDGPKAVALFEQHNHEVVVTDLVMPGLDGMDILRMVREQERFEEVIIITAFGSLESAIESLSLGVFDYITKPFKKEQIIFTIKRAMRWQQMKRESSQMDNMFTIEPYEAARKAFEQEYIHRLAERCKGDPKSMAERSGLSPDRITSLEPDGETEAD